MKCTYATAADDVCIGCARRCLDCVGQEFPERDLGPSSKGRLVGDRISRLESMIQQLAEQVGGQVASSSSPSTLASIALPMSPSVMHSEHQALSQALLAAYLPSSDLRIIGSTGEQLAIYLAREYVTPFHRLERDVAVESERLFAVQQEQPQNTPETHLVLIAGKMLILACVLQHLHAAASTMCSSSNGIRSNHKKLDELSRPPLVLARRVAVAATTLVTAHDRFTSDTLEGLQCLWLEVLYHQHNGNPRHSWLTCRRAISAAQLMGSRGRGPVPLSQPKSVVQRSGSEASDLQQIWLRLVQSEIALCLALGMRPSAFLQHDTFTSAAHSAITEDNATNTRKLEERHAAIASRLIERNDRDPDFEDSGAALQIRTALEDAAAAMPSVWWLMPNLADHTGDQADSSKHLFEPTMKLRAQIFHSYLLLLAHLPFMLQEICSTTTTATPERHSHHHDHNRDHDRNHLFASDRNFCTEASRDLLRRFIHLRSHERTAGSFRLLDHYAWEATATLLLARLLEDRQKTTTTTTFSGDLEPQQRLSDRGMASEAIDRMRLAGEENEQEDEEDGRDGGMYNYYYSSGASEVNGTGDVLSRLLALEAGGHAVVVTYQKPGGTFIGPSSGVPVDEDQDTLVLHFPSVGHVSISPIVQNASAVPPSGAMGCFPGILENEAGLRSLAREVGDEDEEYDEDEAILAIAIELRHSAKCPKAPYMCMLRPVT